MGLTRKQKKKTQTSNKVKEYVVKHEIKIQNKDAMSDNKNNNNYLHDNNNGTDDIRPSNVTYNDHSNVHSDTSDIDNDTDNLILDNLNGANDTDDIDNATENLLLDNLNGANDTDDINNATENLLLDNLNGANDTDDIDNATENLLLDNLNGANDTDDIDNATENLILDNAYDANDTADIDNDSDNVILINDNDAKFTYDSANNTSNVMLDKETHIVDIYCKKHINASLTKVKILYPRLCLECSGIFKSKCTFSKHKKLGRCKTRSQKFNDDINSEKQNKIYKIKMKISSLKDSLRHGASSFFTKNIISENIEKTNQNENLSSECRKQNEIIRRLDQFKEEDEICPDPNEIDDSPGAHIFTSIAQYRDTVEEKKMRNLSNVGKSCRYRPNNTEMLNLCGEDIKNEFKQSKQNSPLMECAICSRFYKSKRSFLNHLKYCPKSNKTQMIQSDKDHDYGLEHISFFFPSFEEKRKPKTLNQYIKCKDCFTLYINKYSFSTHKNKNLCDINIKRIPCIYNSCDLKFTRYEHMISHLPQYHNDNSFMSQTKYFINFNEFENWKFKEQNERFVYLVKTRGIRIYNGTAYYYYECQFNAVNSKKRGGKRKTERRKKLGIIPHVDCPARMIVAKNIESGYVAVNYIKKHTHELSCSQARFQRYPKQVIDHIAAELQQGVHPRQILEYYLKDLCLAENFEEKDLKLTHLINLKFITNLKATLRKQGKLPEKHKHILTDTSLSLENELELQHVFLENELELQHVFLENELDVQHENTNNYEIVTVGEDVMKEGENEIVVMSDDDNSNFQMVSIGEEKFTVVPVFNMEC